MQGIKFIGKLGISNETEKFKPFVVKTSEKGWETTRLLVNVICGDSRHMLTVSGGHWKDEDRRVLKKYTQAYTDDNGNKHKGEPLDVKYSDRFKPEITDKVAGFMKYVFDIGDQDERKILKELDSNYRDGMEVSDEDLKKVGLTSASEIPEAYKKSLAKRKVFIHEPDFALFIKKVIDSGKYNDKMFEITAKDDYNYVTNVNGESKIYSSIIPTKIELVPDDSKPKAEAVIKLIINKDSVSDVEYEETGKVLITGHQMVYCKDTINKVLPVPTTIVLKNNDKKFIDRMISERFYGVAGDEYREMGCVVDMINGAERIPFDESMLSDEEKFDLEVGIVTMEDLRREHGASAFGDRINELRFLKIAYGYASKGNQETVYTEEDMKPKMEDDSMTEGMFESETAESNIEDDIFNDDDLL